MKIEVARILVSEMEAYGYDVRLYEDYSGRGMYGKETTGVVVPDLKTFLHGVAMTAVYLATDGASDPELPMAKEFVEEMKKVREDSLGTDLIVY